PTAEPCSPRGVRMTALPSAKERSMNTCNRSVAILAMTTLALVVLGTGSAAEKDAKPDKPARTVATLDVAALVQRIDRAIQEKLDPEKMPASPLANDAEFLRRVYLDLAGVIPPADKVAAFLDSKEPDKRAKLIDELLASPAYGRHMADI